MKKTLKWLVFIAALAGLGIDMPSCPGQKEMKQQVDSLQATQADTQKKLQTLNQQFTTLNNDMNQVKQLLPQMTNVIQAQKGALEQLDAAVKELQSKSKGGSKKKGR